MAQLGPERKQRFELLAACFFFMHASSVLTGLGIQLTQFRQMFTTLYVVWNES